MIDKKTKTKEEELYKHNLDEFSIFSKELEKAKKIINKSESKPTRIDCKLISERSIKKEILKNLKSNEITDILLNLKRIHLDNMKIAVIENLTIYTNLTHLYLQNNAITEINDEFDFMFKLEYLNLKNNCIKNIKNLKHLDMLNYLNLENNEISEIIFDEIPKNLNYFNVRNNRFEKSKIDEIRKEIILRCDYLLVLDTKDVTIKERKQYGAKVIEEMYKEKEKLKKKVIKPKTTLLTQVKKPEIDSHNFEKIVNELQTKHSLDMDIQNFTKSRKKTNYYEKLLQETQKINNQHISFMEKEIENVKLEFDRKSKEIIKKSRERRKKQKENFSDSLSDGRGCQSENISKLEQYEKKKYSA